MVTGRALTVLSLVAVLTSGLPLSAQDTELLRAPLKGIAGVHVVVEGFDEVAERAGFDQHSFQTDVESKLRMARIKLLSEEEMFETPGMPSLYVNVNATHQRPNEITAFSIDLELSQMVLLARDPSIVCPAVTWSHGSAGQGAISKIRKNVEEFTHKFIENWHSENPKK